MELCVLIVDDDDSFRELLKNFLAAIEGYQVKACKGGNQAFEILKRERIDVVILDHGRARVPGLKVLQWMNEESIATPVIMLATLGSEAIIAKALRLGAYDYVRKEHLELNHVPIIINGVRERYLFRKLREQQAKEAAEAAQQRQVIEGFQKAIEDIALSVNTGLTILLSESKEYEDYFYETRRASSVEGERQTGSMFGNFRQEVETIAAGVHSLIAFSKLIFSKYTQSHLNVQ